MKPSGIICALICTALAACGGSNPDHRAGGDAVFYGTVQAEHPVKSAAYSPRNGALMGSAAGGVVGSLAGSAGTAAGATTGALLGTNYANTQKPSRIAYTVAMENGTALSVVQNAPSDDRVIQVGERVKVVGSGSSRLIVPVGPAPAPSPREDEAPAPAGPLDPFGGQ